MLKGGKIEEQQKKRKEVVAQKGVMTRKVLVLVVTGRRVGAPLGVIVQGAPPRKAGGKRPDQRPRAWISHSGTPFTERGAPQSRHIGHMTNRPARAARHVEQQGNDELARSGRAL